MFGPSIYGYFNIPSESRIPLDPDSIPKAGVVMVEFCEDAGHRDGEYRILHTYRDGRRMLAPWSHERGCRAGAAVLTVTPDVFFSVKRIK